MKRPLGPDAPWNLGICLESNGKCITFTFHYYTCTTKQDLSQIVHLFISKHEVKAFLKLGLLEGDQRKLMFLRNGMICSFGIDVNRN